MTGRLTEHYTRLEHTPKKKQLLDVATAGAVALLRGGSGAFVQGYKVEFVPDSESKFFLCVEDQRGGCCCPTVWLMYTPHYDSKCRTGLAQAVADDDYAFVSQGGKKSKETSAAFIRRPKQPLVIYEFQVRLRPPMNDETANGPSPNPNQTSHQPPNFTVLFCIIITLKSNPTAGRAAPSAPRCGRWSPSSTSTSSSTPAPAVRTTHRALA